MSAVCLGMVVVSMQSPGLLVAPARGVLLTLQAALARGITDPATAVLSRACSCCHTFFTRASARPRPPQAPVQVMELPQAPATAGLTLTYLHLCDDLLSACSVILGRALGRSLCVARVLVVVNDLPHRRTLPIWRLRRDSGTRGKIPSHRSPAGSHRLAVKTTRGMPHPPLVYTYIETLADSRASPISGFFFN